MRRNGSRLTIEISIHTTDIQDHKLLSVFFRDITARKETELQREHQALHDALTGLTNRRGLDELLPRGIARANRNRKAMALLFMDLDGFKAVNDTFGHEGGDKLLKEIAARLIMNIRQTDRAIRLASDEFVVLLEGVEGGLTHARAVAKKLLFHLSQPVVFDKGIARVGVSIGIAVFLPDTPRRPEDLLNEADSWMYRAKRVGKGCILPEN